MSVREQAAAELSELRRQLRVFKGSRIAEIAEVPPSAVSKLQSGVQGCTFMTVRSVQLAINQLYKSNHE